LFGRQVHPAPSNDLQVGKIGLLLLIDGGGLVLKLAGGLHMASIAGIPPNQRGRMTKDATPRPADARKATTNNVRSSGIATWLARRNQKTTVSMAAESATKPRTVPTFFCLPSSFSYSLYLVLFTDEPICLNERRWTN